MKKILNWELFLEELVGESPISNLQTYIDRMNLSMGDKLFFLKKLDFDVIVDFGCADGELLSTISKMNPDVKVVGYDLDKKMLLKAKSKLPEGSLVTDNWEEVINFITDYEKPLLNLSSVIHEVYSYSNKEDINNFWVNQVFGGYFKYISIRDMMPSFKLAKEDIYQYKDDLRKVRQKADKKQLKSFEDRWGSINTNYSTFVHYLLKYRYVENWDREVNENYLPITIEDLREKIPTSYKIIYEDNFLLQFIKNQVKRDFGVNLTHPTHTKMIIENKNFKSYIRESSEYDTFSIVKSKLGDLGI